MTGGESFWIASTVDPDYPRLEEEIGVSVAVVGGGITGLTTALMLQDAGRDAVVLEAGAIGHGVTGATTGKLTVGQGLAYSKLEAHHGEEMSVRYAASQTAALERVFELAAEHNIECDLERVTNYVFAEHEDEVSMLEAEARAATRAGLDADVVVGLDLPFPALAAVAIDGQGQFHARKYLLGLARAFERAGGRIFQNTRVNGVDNTARRRASLKLETGRVDADQVVLATHVPITMQGAFFARVHPYAAYAIAAPVPDGTLDGMWINVGEPTRSLRTNALEDGDRLLIVVGEGHRVGQDQDTPARYEALAEYARDHYPEIEIAYRWSTQDQYPVDGLPYIGRLADDGPYVATGFAGWGLTNGTLAGMLLSDTILGRDNEFSSLFDPNRSSLVRAARTMLRENANVARQLVGGKLRVRPDSLDAIEVGSGAVVTVDRKKVAAFRDDGGAVTAVSAACTHMGCDVAWNEAERTWDCPCHGSRFAVTGDVLEGPALEPLAPVDVQAPAGAH